MGEEELNMFKKMQVCKLYADLRVFFQYPRFKFILCLFSDT